MSYKKNILSLAAILAISTSVNADTTATYTQFTNTSNDNAWILFGVNGFATGVPSAINTNGVFTNGYQPVTEDSLSDDLATPFEGIGATAPTVSGNGIFASASGENMATIQAIKDPDGTPYFTGSSLVVAIDSITSTYSDTQSVRTMYIAIEDSPAVSKIKLSYKAALEGKKFELQIDSAGAVYKGTISQTATFSSPAVARDTPIVTQGTEKTTPEETLVYDLGNAPIDAKAYDITKHQGDTDGADRFYRYDAATATWLLWDRANAASVNSLTAFEKGKAYWGRIDTSGASGDQNPAISDVRAGLYLGNNTGLDEANASVYTGKLTPDAWNMIAFDPAKNADIRNSTTGLLVDINDDFDDGDTITILDATGQNSVTITFTDTITGASVANFINEQIEVAKLLGKIPNSFNVKVFDITTTKFAFISDERFTLEDGTNTKLTTATTLAGKDPIITATGLRGAVADVADTGVTSVYGEYVMIVNPLVGANTASAMDNILSGDGASIGSAAVQFGNIEGEAAYPTLLGTDNTATDLTTAQTAFTANEIFAAGGALTTDSTGLVSQIDTNLDGTPNMLLLAADKAFYIKDNTFTRVYTVDATNASGTTVVVQPAGTTTAAIGGNTISDIQTAINNLADTVATTTEVYADIDPSDATKLVVFSKKSPLVNIEDVASATVDLFSASSSDSDIAKGAIKEVLNVSKLARTDLGKNSWSFTFTTDANGTDGGAGDNAIVVNETAAADTVIDAATDTDALRLAMLNSFVTKINSAMAAAGIAGFASHNYIDGYDDITKATITIEGVGLNTVEFNEDDGTLAIGAISDANSATAGKIDTAASLMVADLKGNAIYTPDYVNAGPLYTLKDAGYELKALLSASTKLADTPTTHWDNIDLTRESDKWFDNNEYNLFNVDASSGYWGYVVDYAGASTISVGTKVFTPAYTHHFNTATGVVENLLTGGTVSVEVLDSASVNGYLNAETANAKLIVDGSEVQLMKSGTSFTAQLTEPETTLAALSAPISIGIKVADGLGETFEDTELFSLDYSKPEAPTTSFTANELTLSSTSADAAGFYIWEDYIPDNLASPLVTAATAPINMCFTFSFGSTHALKAIAVDGTGKLTEGLASNITAFGYTNVTKSATILTHSNGEATSSVLIYDDACLPTTVTTKSGMDIKAVQVGTVSLAFEALTGDADSTADIPFTAYFSVGGTKVIEVTYLEAYAGKTVFVEYNGELYTTTLLATRNLADDTFSTPVDLTVVPSSDNKVLR